MNELASTPATKIAGLQYITLTFGYHELHVTAATLVPDESGSATLGFGTWTFSFTGTWSFES